MCENIYERINPSGEKVYIIRKTFNKKMFNYGTYHTLQEALKKRDYLIENNWNRPLYKYYYRQTGSGHYTIQKHNKEKNKQIKYGTVHTLKEAKKIIDYLITYDWDINKLPSEYKKLIDKNKNYRGIKKDSKHYYQNNSGEYMIYKDNKYIYHTITKEAAEKYVEYLKKHNWKKRIPKFYYYNKKLKRYVIVKNKKGKIKYYGSHKTVIETKKHVEKLIIKGELKLI